MKNGDSVNRRFLIGRVTLPFSIICRRANVSVSRCINSPMRCRTAARWWGCKSRQSVFTAARAEVRNLFALVGSVLEIPEKRFDAFTVTYSSSHGYHALAALIRGAEAIGLDRKSARVAAAHALADGIAAWRTGNLPLKELLQEAATPGGIAATVMASLDAAGYPEIIAQALRAGVRQARKNARQ